VTAIELGGLGTLVSMAFIKTVSFSKSDKKVSLIINELAMFNDLRK